jgi:hypothetical protein
MLGGGARETSEHGCDGDGGAGVDVEAGSDRKVARADFKSRTWIWLIYLTLPVDSRRHYILDCWQIVERVVRASYGLTANGM